MAKRHRDALGIQQGACNPSGIARALSAPLAYIENGVMIPAKWRAAFKRELQSDNKPYADNIRAKIAKFGVLFTDGKGLE